MTTWGSDAGGAPVRVSVPYAVGKKGGVHNGIDDTDFCRHAARSMADTHRQNTDLRHMLRERRREIRGEVRSEQEHSHVGPALRRGSRSLFSDVVRV